PDSAGWSSLTDLSGPGRDIGEPLRSSISHTLLTNRARVNTFAHSHEPKLCDADRYARERRRCSPEQMTAQRARVRIGPRQREGHAAGTCPVLHTRSLLLPLPTRLRAGTQPRGAQPPCDSAGP